MTGGGNIATVLHSRERSTIDSGEKEAEREGEPLRELLSLTTEMVCEWKHWLFHRMAYTTCSAGHCSTHTDCFAHSIGLSHFIKETHSWSKF